MTTLLHRFLSGELSALLIEPDGRQWDGLKNRPTEAVLAGSFNPLHAGHLGLTCAAAEILNASVSFELCICNADKPPLAAEEIAARLRQFAWRHPVWLTRAATFAEKAGLFPGAVFVVGVDTAERILSPRFYPQGKLGRDQALAMFRGRGCRFLVAARSRFSIRAGSVSDDTVSVQAGSASGGQVSFAYASGSDGNERPLQTQADLDIPAGFHDLFQELPASIFRLDISSTQLRPFGSESRGREQEKTER